MTTAMSRCENELAKTLGSPFPKISWHHMREYEQALCTHGARLMPSSCRVILLADRGFATVQFFRALDALGKKRGRRDLRGPARRCLRD